MSAPSHPTAPPERPRRGGWLWLVLAAAAGAVFGAVFIESALKDQIDLGFSEVDQADMISGLEIFNASVSGRTAAGEPFVLTSESALPDGPTPERVRLDDVIGDASLRDGRTATLAATAGMLYVNDQRVSLTGGVRVETSDGHWLATDTLILDTRRGALSTDAEVHAAGPISRIRADRLETLDQAQRVAVFRGGVKVTVAPSSPPQDQEDASAPPLDAAPPSGADQQSVQERISE